MVDFVNQAEAAELLGVPDRQIAKYRSGGRLPFSKHANGGIAINRRQVVLLATILAEPRPTKEIRKAMSADAAELPIQLLRPLIRAAIAAV